MKFSKQYIEICHKLPKREINDWQVGDFCYYPCHYAVYLIIEGGPSDELFTVISPEYAVIHHDIPMEDLIWLPHRESQWIEILGEYHLLHRLEDVWQVWFLNKKPGTTPHDVLLYPFNEIMDLKKLSEENNPLMACALAWLKAVGK